MADKRLYSLETLSKLIIDNIQPTYDGGLIGFALEEDLIRNGSHQLVKKVFDHIYHKGTYNVALCLGIIWAVLLPLCAFICLVWTCYTSRSKCCQSNSKVQLVWESLNKKVFGLLKNEKHVQGPKGHKKKSRPVQMPTERQRNIIVVIIVLGIALFSVFMILAYFSNNAVQWTMDEYEQPALKPSVNASFDDFQRFLVRGIEEGSNLTKTTMNDFSSELQNIVKKAVGSFTDALLLDYGVTKLFTSANKAMDDIQNVLAAMQFIRDSQSTKFKRLYEFKGFMDTMRKQLENLKEVCKISQPVSSTMECLRLDGLIKQLVVPIDQSRLNFESSTSMLFLLREMSLNISSMANEVTKARKSIDTMLGTVYVSIQKDFNLDAILGSVDDVWATADTFVSKEVIDPMTTVQSNGTIDSYIDTVSSVRKVTIGVIGFLYFMFIVFVICLLVMILALPFGNNQSQIKYVKVKNYSPPGELSISTVNNSLKQLLPTRRKEKIPISVFNGFVLFMGFLTLIPAIVVVLSFLAGGVLQTEVCRYMVDKRGLKISDQIIDSYLNNNWDSLLQDVNVSFGGIKINLKQPKNILNAITVSCSNETEGLLDAVGFRDLLDIDSLVKSKMFRDMIGMGKTYAKKTIGTMNGATLIPSNLTPILKDAINLTKMLVDNMEYKNSIVELQKPLLVIKNYTKFIFDLDAYVNMMRTKHPSSDSVVFLAKVTPMLEERLGVYEALEKDLKLVLKNYILLQDTRTVSSGLAKLVDHLRGVQKILSNSTRMVSVVDPIYDGIMNWTVSDIKSVLQRNLKILEERLLPCDDLTKAYNTTTYSVCTTFLQEFNAFSVCYGCCVLLLQMLFFVLWILLRKIRLQQLPMTQKQNDSVA